jgi:Fe-S cluster assembly protein SufB
MEWIDGNIGSRISMKYPACILAGEYAHGMCISIAVGSKGQFQDTGAKMIHLAPHTSSSIISKSVSRNGGVTNFRDWIRFGKKADYSKTKIECDTLILDPISSSDTIPLNISENATSTMEHEAKVSKISEDELFYLMSRGLTEAQATEMIIMGFLEPFTRELPMEYAVELNQLLKIDMSDSIG